MNNIPQRPTVTQEMKFEAAKALVAEHGLDAHNANDIADQYSFGMDGFELAKELDKWAYWDTSRDEMEALDDMDYRVRALLKAEEERWFADNNIQPPLPIGSKVKCHGGTGVITEISNHAVAYYAVKPDGQDDASCGNRRYLVRFEDAVLQGEQP